MRRNKLTATVIMGIILGMSSPFFLSAQLLDPVDIRVDSFRPAAGDEGLSRMTIRAEIREGWYLYSTGNDPADGPIPTAFAAASEGHSIEGVVRESEAVVKYDPNFDTELGLHSGSATFEIPLRIHPAQEADTVLVQIRYQACDDISCLPPRVKETGVVLNPPCPDPAPGEDPSYTILETSDRPDIAFRGEEAGVHAPEGVRAKNLFLFSALFAAAALLALLLLRRRRTG